MIVLTRKPAPSLLIDLSTGTEGFLTKTDGPHTIGFAATHGFPRGAQLQRHYSKIPRLNYPKGQSHFGAAVTCARDQTH